jgi:hypothetical protein
VEEEDEEITDLSGYRQVEVKSRADDFEAVDIKDLDFMKKF